MTSGPADTGASTGFTDALAGADGTADPSSPIAPVRIYPDPTQDVFRDAGSDRWVTSSTGATTLVTPGSPIAIDPAMVAKAEAEIAQRRAAAEQAAATKADQERRHAEGARRDAATRAAARTHAPQLPPQVLNFTQWLPPSAQEAVRKGLAQRGGGQIGTGQSGRAPQPARPLARPAPPPPPKVKRKSSGNSVWGVLVFIVVVLFATGLGQRIVEALSQLFNR